jgi:hypothetical protein
MNCVFCGEEVSIVEKVSRNDSCPTCGKDLRCCRQCKFYMPNAYNECTEVLADRIVDKERANFCDYFVPRGSSEERGNRTQNAKEALEALFRK